MAPSTLSRRRLLLIYLLIAILPFPIGALCIKLTSVSSTPRMETVVISIPADQSGQSTAAEIADDLQRSTAFDWSIARTANPAAVLPDGSNVAVVSISLDIANQDLSRARQVPVIAIIPGRIAQDAHMYATLVRIVSESASRAGIADLFESISGARIKMNVASLTTAGIDGALAQASASLDQAIGSFSPAMSQFEPLIANAQELLSTLQTTARSLTTVADRLTSFAKEIGTLDATLGDMRDGMQLSEDTLRAFRPTLSQGLPLAESIAESLKGSGSPNLQLLGNQVGIILQLLSIETDNSSLSKVLASISTVSAEDLSQLLAAHVDRETRISDFLLIAARRLRYYETTIDEAGRTLDRAASLFNSARADLPRAKAVLSSEIENFKRLVGELSKQLDAATKQLPDTSHNAADAAVGTGRLQLWSAGGRSVDETLGAATVLLLGAFAIALLTRILFSRSVPTKWLIVVGASLCLGLLTPLNMAVYDRYGLVVGVAMIAAVSMVELFSLLIALFGQWGSVVITAIVALGLVDYGNVSELDNIVDVLPSYYMSTSLREAIQGLSSELVLVLAVLIASGVAASITRRKWTKTLPGTQGSVSSYDGHQGA